MLNTIEIKEVKQVLGQLVKVLRKNRGFSQIELATKLGISRTTLQNLELGKNFTVDTLFKVLKQLDQLEVLYDGISKAKTQLSQMKSLY